MASPYDNLIELMKKLNVNDDGIKMNQKIKSVETIFYDIVSDEDKLKELLEYMNDCILKDTNVSTAQNFAMLMTSRNLHLFAIDDTVLRYKIISLLQKNFMKYDEYSKNDKNMLYNSITLLGEYYHRYKTVNGSCISELGEALLEMLTKEINQNNSESKSIDIILAKIILSQVTLNGKLLQTHHNEKFNNFLFHIRRVIIELNDIGSCIRALLLMTLDLFYNNFCSLGTQLEETYTKYLIEAEKIVNDSTIVKEKIKNCNLIDKNYHENEENDEQQKNGIEELINKCEKWSEQVHEENLKMLSMDNASDSNSSTHGKNGRGYEGKNSIWNKDSDGDYNNQLCEYDDDQQSIRSEGGTLRLYSVKDRFKNLRTNHASPSQNPSDVVSLSPSRNDRHYLPDKIQGNTKTNHSANNYNRNSNNSYTRNTFNRVHQQYDRPPRFNRFQPSSSSNYNQNQNQQQSQNAWREEAANLHDMNFDRRDNTRGNDREYKRGGYSNGSSNNRNHQNNRNFSARSPLNNYHQRDTSFDRKSTDSNRHFRRGGGGGNVNNSFRGTGRNFRSNNHDDKRYNNENYRNRRQSVESAGNEGNIRNRGRYGSQNSLSSEQSKPHGTYNRRSRFSSTNRSQEYSY